MGYSPRGHKELDTNETGTSTLGLVAPWHVGSFQTRNQANVP